MIGGGGNRGSGAISYKLQLIKNIVLGFFVTKSIDPTIDISNIKKEYNNLLESITDSTNINNNSIFYNFLN